MTFVFLEGYYINSQIDTALKTSRTALLAEFNLFGRLSSLRQTTSSRCDSHVLLKWAFVGLIRGLLFDHSNLIGKFDVAFLLVGS